MLPCITTHLLGSISTSSIDRISDDQSTILINLTNEGIDQIPEDRFAGSTSHLLVAL